MYACKIMITYANNYNFFQNAWERSYEMQTMAGFDRAVPRNRKFFLLIAFRTIL